MNKPEKPKQITLSLVLGYIIGIVTLIIGLAVIVLSFLGGLLIMVGGLIVLPPSIKYIEKKFNIHLSIWLKIVAFLVLFIIGMSLASSNSKSQKERMNVTTPEPVGDEDIKRDVKIDTQGESIKECPGGVIPEQFYLSKYINSRSNIEEGLIFNPVKKWTEAEPRWKDGTEILTAKPYYIAGGCYKGYKKVKI